MQLNKILKFILSNSWSGLFFTPPYYKNSVSYFFSDPYETVNALNRKELFTLLEKMDRLSSGENYAFGFFNYEAGFAFEKKLNKYSDNSGLLASFGFYKKENVTEIPAEEMNMFSEGDDFYEISSLKVNTDFEEYKRSVMKIKNHISEGDTYQVNYTVKNKFNFKGDPAGLFRRLLFNQSAQYTAFLNLGENLIISLSPELFFRISGRNITVRPMKGTISRGNNNDDDLVQESILKNSEKNKAENLMIVDLMRNDLGKICRFNSVKVNSLFDVEKYETLFQMTSGIEGQLNDEIQFSDIIKNIFPSGSVTGAPKISTMGIIKNLEKEKRGVYTGSIGFVKNNKSVFNVAIRTIVLDKKNGTGELGTGSGIVWDSGPRNEYEELILKSRFLSSPEEPFQVFETMKAEKGSVPLLQYHLKRLKAAAGYFLFSFEEKKIVSLLKEKLRQSDLAQKYRIKILLSKYGRVFIEQDRYPELPSKIKVIVSEKKTDSSDRFRFFKTTRRKIYDDEYTGYSREGFFDVIFMNEKDKITEGAITNIFIRKDSQWITPPVNSGILNGVFRTFLLQRNENILEKDLCPDDLFEASEIMLTNALRGEMKVDEIYLNRFKFKWF